MWRYETPNTVAIFLDIAQTPAVSDHAINGAKGCRRVWNRALLIWYPIRNLVHWFRGVSRGSNRGSVRSSLLARLILAERVAAA